MLLTLLILFSAAFAITHLGLSHGGVRAGLVRQLGPMRFRLLYSAVALGTFAPAAVIAFRERHLGPVLWELNPLLVTILASILMLAAILLIVLSLANPSPSSMLPARPEARGVLRVTRHPMNMGWALFGIAHLLGNSTLGDVSFFGLCFVVVGLIGPFHMDSRKKAERGEVFAAFLQQTSVLPFLAVVSRRQKLVLSEIPLPMTIIAVAVWIALFVFHGRLFGVSLV